MTTPREPRNTYWLPYAGFALAVGGIVYQGGVVTSGIEQNTKRIDKIETVSEARTNTLALIEMRTVRIEVKLDAMQEQQRREDSRR